MIILKNLKWSNCFSYGKDNHLDLQDNIIVQLIGENGAGKSTIPLLLEEALFNKNSKGVKKVDIVNRNSPKDGYQIILDFTVNDKDYSISVNRKASIKVVLLCNGEDISSHTATNTFKTVENVLGLDFKTFSQLVYQSTNNSLQFLTATDTNRKKFLIELLNLDNYLKLFDNFKEAHKEAASDVAEIKGSINTIKAWIKSNPITSTTKKELLELPTSPEDLISEKALIQERLDNIKDINNKINLNNQYRSQLSEIDAEELTKETNEPVGIADLNTEYATIKNLSARAVAVIMKIDKLGTSCPTCLQEIHKEKVEELKSEQNTIIKKNNYRSKEISLDVRDKKAQLKEHEEHQRIIQKFEKFSSLVDQNLPQITEDKTELERKISSLNEKISEKENEIRDISNENTSITKFNTELDYLTSQVKEFKLKLFSEESNLKKSNDVYANLEVLKKAFSTNGLVAYKIENLVKDLEDLVNEYLAELSDGRFGLQFAVTNDKLNVIISDEGKDIDILALSSGELARVNTSTLLAIRRLMSTLSKSRINALFLDEVIGVLDDEGREKLIEILLKEHELNTFLVSHGWSHPLLSKANVIKTDNISRIEWQ
jgi:DNA repair exonuclease SbcCD ATPase subunit